MDSTDENLLRIGVFSTLSQISPRMLRHYQERGVLEPAQVDPFTGHRYYHPSQLRTANLVVQLREAGFPVSAISQLVKSEDPAQVAAAIDAQRLELGGQRKRLHAQLAALDLVSTTLRGRPEMTEVRREKTPEMVVASLRRTMPTYQDEGQLWEELTPLLQQAGVAFPAGGLCGATYHDPDHKDTDVDVEVWTQVTEPFTPAPPLSCRTMPAQEVIAATLLGDYSQMASISNVLGAYIAEHQLETGPMFNIYRVGPAQNPDPSSWVTEVCFPVLKG